MNMICKGKKTFPYCDPEIDRNMTHKLKVPVLAEESQGVLAGCALINLIGNLQSFRPPSRSDHLKSVYEQPEIGREPGLLPASRVNSPCRNEWPSPWRSSSSWG